MPHRKQGDEPARSLEQLQLREVALREAQRLGEIGSWEWDLRTDIVTWSEELHCLFGSDPTQPPPPFLQSSKLVRPTSWPMLQEAVRCTRENGVPYRLALEYHRTDSTLGWIEVRGEAVTDDRGRIVGLRGTAQDVTGRKAALPDAEPLPRSTPSERPAPVVRVSERVRNALNQVIGSAHLLRRLATPKTKEARWVDQILAGSQRIEAAMIELEEAKAADFSIPAQAGSSDLDRGPADEAMSRLRAAPADLRDLRVMLQAARAEYENRRAAYLDIVTRSATDTSLLADTEEVHGAMMRTLADYSELAQMLHDRVLKRLSG